MARQVICVVALSSAHMVLTLPAVVDTCPVQEPCTGHPAPAFG